MRVAATVLFLLSGALAAVLAHVVYGWDVPLVTWAVAIALLLPGVGIAWGLAWRLGWIKTPPTRNSLAWLAIAAPFPYSLVIWLYGTRTQGLPESWQQYVNNPTAYLLWTTGMLAASLAWTSWVLIRALPRHAETPAAFRALALTLFVLMGMVASVGDPVWTSDLFNYALEPLATVLFATVFGWRLSFGQLKGRSSLGL